MLMKRGWINAPSTLQKCHEFHGMNVFYNPSDINGDGRTTVYPIEGDIVSLMVHNIYIAKDERWIKKPISKGE